MEGKKLYIKKLYIILKSYLLLIFAGMKSRIPKKALIEMCYILYLEGRADEMEIVCSRGGFGLKGFTFSGKNPPEKLMTSDGESICVRGIHWFSKTDVIYINIADLNSSKKIRGKKQTVDCSSNETRSTQFNRTTT